MRLKGGVPDPLPPALEQAEVDGSNENGYGEQHPSLATVRGLLRHSGGRRLVVHNGDISYARCAPAPHHRRLLSHSWSSPELVGAPPCCGCAASQSGALSACV